MAETAREEASGTAPSLKVRTARTLKWNGIDRISTQVLYAVTGVVLANVLSKDDFGLVGVFWFPGFCHDIRRQWFRRGSVAEETPPGARLQHRVLV